ncbi:chemotaxis protein [Cohaesibacter sp. CAU 1516]|uniref:rod-binding protein n=1 Tax=Cohaesibacter sp. CAU 1516 TaxID=2576038 RepID=UPI0010FE3440|nr:rod-binding protein [Cohaesibacter sp. CAU 1516]TLP48526.1 chemotaxis protein [Cohaesibacter sp. CAU 1516]
MTTLNATPFSIAPNQGLNSQLNSKEQARAVAEQFEGVFLNQMMSAMFEGVGKDDAFGGSYAEETYRGLLTETYADTITKSGGIGIADSIMRELISLQEMEQ